MSENIDDGNTIRVARLIDESGFKGYDDGVGAIRIPFVGRLRTWEMLVYASNDWVCFRTPVLTLPKNKFLRSAVLETVTTINAEIAVGKFATAWGATLTLDAEYREAHVDAATMRSLITMLHRIAEEHYPAIVRAAMCSDQLDALEKAFRDGPEAA